MGENKVIIKGHQFTLVYDEAGKYYGATAEDNPELNSFIQKNIKETPDTDNYNEFLNVITELVIEFYKK